jgi:hypothetical protein
MVLVLSPAGPERRFQRKIGRVYLGQFMDLCELVDFVDPAKRAASGLVFFAPDRVWNSDDVALPNLIQPHVTEFRENEILQRLPVLMNVLTQRHPPGLAVFVQPGLECLPPALVHAQIKAIPIRDAFRAFRTALDMGGFVMALTAKQIEAARPGVGPP